MKKVENVIYILTTPQYPGYVKIGYASDLKSRISSLSTGLMLNLIPYGVYETPAQNGDHIIHNIIKLLNPMLRAKKFNNGKEMPKEFFKLEPEEAFELLQYIAKVSGTESHVYLVTPDCIPIKDDKKEKSLKNKKIELKTNSINRNDFKQEEQDNLNKIKEEQIIPNGTYVLSRKVKKWNNQIVKATVIVNGNNWTLQPGSMICPVFSGHDQVMLDRLKKLRSSVKIINNILKEPVIFTSASNAACFCLGGTTNGWQNWRTLNGEIIDIYRH